MTHLLWISGQNQFIRFEDRDPTYRLDRLGRFIDYTNVKLDIVELFRSGRMTSSQNDLSSVPSLLHRTHTYLGGFDDSANDLALSLTMLFPQIPHFLPFPTPLFPLDRTLFTPLFSQIG